MGASAGCVDGVILPSRSTAYAETTTPPEITARDYSPENPVTTFELKWRAVATDRMDVKASDGIETTPFTYAGESVFIVLGYEAKNVGEEPHVFNPDSLYLHTEEKDYFSAALTHLTPFLVRKIRPGVTTSGFVAIIVPKDLERAEVAIDERDYDTSVAFDLEQDSSVWLPF